MDVQWTSQRRRAEDQGHVRDIGSNGVSNAHFPAARESGHGGNQHLGRGGAKGDDGQSDHEPADPEVAGEAGRSIHETIGTPDQGDETDDNRGYGVEQGQENLFGETRTGQSCPGARACKPRADRAGKTTPQSAIRDGPIGGESMGERLRDKVAIVTGASRGIGAAIAGYMAEEGAKVVLVSRKIDGLQTVADQIRSQGGDATPIACHVGQPKQREDMLEQALKAYGKVDILVNNAATNPHFGPMLSIDERAWDKTFEVNVKGYFGMIQLVAGHLQERKAKGSLVNIASVVGLMGAPMQGVYAMTKSAVISMTRTLAMELGAGGIRVNAIAPGLIETKFAQVLVDNDEIRSSIVNRTALGRVGQPRDIAGGAVFLASDESDYLTGDVMVIDGGWTIT